MSCSLDILWATLYLTSLVQLVKAPQCIYAVLYGIVGEPLIVAGVPLIDQRYWWPQTSQNQILFSWKENSFVSSQLDWSEGLLWEPSTCSGLSELQE